jgi:hypothetical protein
MRLQNYRSFVPLRLAKARTRCASPTLAFALVLGDFLQSPLGWGRYQSCSRSGQWRGLGGRCFNYFHAQGPGFLVQ